MGSLELRISSSVPSFIPHTASADEIRLLPMNCTIAAVLRLSVCGRESSAPVSNLLVVAVADSRLLQFPWTFWNRKYGMTRLWTHFKINGSTRISQQLQRYTGLCHLRKLNRCRPSDCPYVLSFLYLISTLTRSSTVLLRGKSSPKIAHTSQSLYKSGIAVKYFGYHHPHRCTLTTRPPDGMQQASRKYLN
eukprot:IDg23958t1